MAQGSRASEHIMNTTVFHLDGEETSRSQQRCSNEILYLCNTAFKAITSMLIIPWEGPFYQPYL